MSSILDKKKKICNKIITHIQTYLERIESDELIKNVNEAIKKINEANGNIKNLDFNKKDASYEKTIKDSFDLISRCLELDQLIDLLVQLISSSNLDKLSMSQTTKDFIHDITNKVMAAYEAYKKESQLIAVNMSMHYANTIIKSLIAEYNIIIDKPNITKTDTNLTKTDTNITKTDTNLIKTDTNLIKTDTNKSNLEVKTSGSKKKEKIGGKIFKGSFKKHSDISDYLDSSEMDESEEPEASEPEASNSEAKDEIEEPEASDSEAENRIEEPEVSDLSESETFTIEQLPTIKHGGNEESALLAGINYIRSQFLQKKNTVSLYALVMQKIIDLLYSFNKPIMFTILNTLEQDKNFMLGENGKRLFASKQSIKSNPPLKRFGMMPVTDSMPLIELLTKILEKETKLKISQDFKKMSKSSGVGFIVMNRIVYTPIEFNIRPLIIKSVAQEFIQSDEFGINEKTIGRFKTIRDFPRSDTWDFSTEIYGEDSEKFYIIETLDGTHYRCLAPWISSKSYSLQRFRVEPLLRYFSAKETTTRATEYHKILEQQATKNMFLKKAVDIESFADKASDVESNSIRLILIKKLIKATKEIIAKTYKNNIVDSIQLSAVIHDSSLASLFTETILLQYNKGVLSDELRNFSAGKFPFSEVMVSFMVELQYITRRFSKEMHDGYSRNPPNEKTYALPKTGKMEIINQKISDIIQETINLIIKDGSNIYSSLHTKYLILNNT